jgi:hypothetical protein
MSEKNITSETIISRSESMLTNDLGDDIVMMDIDEGSYYGLASVSARIWELTETPVSIASICETLISEYDVPKDKCQQEVTNFVEDMLNRKIVQLDE